jgi:mannitol-1-phosphate 5-dehydrogenase
MAGHVFTGFGFGPIQAGLFAAEAFKSSNFKRIIIAEIDPVLVDAIRSNKGKYFVNIALADGIKTIEISGIEIFNILNENDRIEVIKAVSQSTEICTSLPSVNFYDAGKNSVSSLISQGLRNKSADATIIYTAENNNHAAEILEKKTGLFKNVQFLNTVIGKMSQVVIGSEVSHKNLKSITPGIDRAFLVEDFNKIFVTKCCIPGFKTGIEIFTEKEDLLPFEEAKLYGHNAIHAVLAYLGAYKGYKKIAELKNDNEIMQTARNAFINESGAALISKYKYLNDELFTAAGYKVYAEDLLERMTNPYLDDTIERAARDPERKLESNDRIFGTMRLALEYGIEPKNMAKAAAAGIIYLAKIANLDFSNTLCSRFSDNTDRYKVELIHLTEKAFNEMQ